MRNSIRFFYCEPAVRSYLSTSFKAGTVVTDEQTRLQHQEEWTDGWADEASTPGGVNGRTSRRDFNNCTNGRDFMPVADFRCAQVKRRLCLLCFLGRNWQLWSDRALASFAPKDEGVLWPQVQHLPSKPEPPRPVLPTAPLCAAFNIGQKSLIHTLNSVRQ